MRKLVSESINEFERGISKNTLGVGNRVLIVKWLEEMGIKNYSLNKELEIDVEGNVDLEQKGLDRFPVYIKFNRVDGSFFCNANKLITLKGVPNEVGRTFYCNSNNLSTLEGGPKEVGGAFYCSRNKLTTLEGAPAKIGGWFYCNNNEVKFTEEDVRAICEVTGSIII